MFFATLFHELKLERKSKKTLFTNQYNRLLKKLNDLNRLRNWIPPPKMKLVKPKVEQPQKALHCIYSQSKNVFNYSVRDKFSLWTFFYNFIFNLSLELEVKF